MYERRVCTCAVRKSIRCKALRRTSIFEDPSTRKWGFVVNDVDCGSDPMRQVGPRPILSRRVPTLRRVTLSRSVVTTVARLRMVRVVMWRGDEMMGVQEESGK